MADRRYSMDELKARFADRYTEEEWNKTLEQVERINTLKKEKNAVILAHNYMTPLVYHGVADIRGDSLALAREAARVEADVIVLCGVHFMAETAKIVNPKRRVLIPDSTAGCSLAESITAEDVRKLRSQYPGVPVMTYVNTSAAVKAESDICCTSGNVIDLVNKLPGNEVLLIPDQYLAAYAREKTGKTIHVWKGDCEVHRTFTAAEVNRVRKKAGEPLVVIAHPECPQDVIHAADFAGSTAQMLDFIRKENPQRVFLVTECSMSDNLALQFPEIEFIRPCTLCPHMQKITIPKVLEALENMTEEVFVDPDVAERATAAIQAMLDLS